MAPIPLELELPEDLDGAAAVELLSAHLEVDAGAAQRQERLLLDTFDGRLRAAGLSAAIGDGALVLTEPGAPPRSAPASRSRRLLLSDIPDGPVRERLADVLEDRALLALVGVRRTVRPVAVLNSDAKTVVRLEIEHASVARGPGLAPRLHVRPVLGYDGAFEHVSRALTRELGLAPVRTTLFDAAVSAAGLPPEGVSSKVGVRLEPGERAVTAAGKVLTRLAEVAEANVAGTLDDLDPEFLHDLRVAVRRARSVLRELREVHPPQERAHLREELRWVQQVTGPMRDLDVQLLEWDALTAGLPKERGADLKPLHDMLMRRRAAARRALRRDLRAARFRNALEEWRSLAAGPGGPAGKAPIDALAAERIRKVYRRMVRDGSAIAADSPDEALHDLRKRGKELRYLLELFGGLFDSDVVKSMVSSLKRLQNVLGRFQDRAVQAELMRGLGPELAKAEGGPAALMALGLVVEALEADQRAARAQFEERFSAFAAGKQRKLVKATFK